MPRSRDSEIGTTFENRERVALNKSAATFPTAFDSVRFGNLSINSEYGVLAVRY